ncbi:hypothetical protein PT974_10824 [Cladobotryum mycophilum]|uniref:Jacalin-type lectin domain-containing protein n=1 Tax=Cladobotryum mycophilum TaxID=491253 RepID=A0ABR0SAW1_9HYPO
MRPFVGALVAYLAGYAVTVAVPRSHDSSLAHRTTESQNSTDGHPAAKYGLVFNPSTFSPQNSIVTQSRVHGSVTQIQKFINDLTLSFFQRILRNRYGYPFRITFYDGKYYDATHRDGHENYLGSIQGYFTVDGGITWETNQDLPVGAVLPNIQKQPSLAPVVHTVTLSGSQSSKVNAEGTFSDANLRDFLGGDYGKPFRLILTDNLGNNVGFLSGSFSSNGAQFDSHRSITKPWNPLSDSGSGSGSGSSSISFPGSGSNGSPPSGSNGSPGSGSGHGSISVPSPAGSPPAGSNTGSVTIGGQSSAELQSTLNSLSFDYIFKAVGGKYGPFYITFSPSGGKGYGFITGTISRSSYEYHWEYYEY